MPLNRSQRKKRAVLVSQINRKLTKGCLEGTSVFLAEQEKKQREKVPTL